MASFTVSPPGIVAGEGLSFRCALGRGGIANEKREGDGITPVGRWRMLELYYRADRLDRPKTGLPAHIIDAQDGWCDDPDNPSYNRKVRRPFSASHEALWRQDHLYDVLIVLNYNIDPVVPYRGSAIFMHLAREEYGPTEGCVALSRPDFLDLVARCDTDSHLIIHD